jgi:hypothetical protein
VRGRGTAEERGEATAVSFAIPFATGARSFKGEEPDEVLHDCEVDVVLLRRRIVAKATHAQRSTLVGRERAPQ